MSDTMARITARIPNTLDRRLRARAKTTGRTTSEAICDAWDAYLEDAALGGELLRPSETPRGHRLRQRSALRSEYEPEAFGRFREMNLPCVLADTGPLVTMLSRADEYHLACAELARQIKPSAADELACDHRSCLAVEDEANRRRSPAGVGPGRSRCSPRTRPHGPARAAPHSQGKRQFVCK